MERTLAALCELVHGELIGDGQTLIRGVNGFDDVQQDELTFAADDKRLAQAMDSRAAAIVVSKDVGSLQGRCGIRVENPKLAFAVLLEVFHPERLPERGVHPSAVIGKEVRLGEGVSIQAHAVIGNDVSIGQWTTIGSGVSVGDGVTIGERCRLHPNVVVYRQTYIGNRVAIHGHTRSSRPVVCSAPMGPGCAAVGARYVESEEHAFCRGTTRSDRRRKHFSTVGQSGPDGQRGISGARRSTARETGLAIDRRECRGR